MKRDPYFLSTQSIVSEISSCNDEKRFNLLLSELKIRGCSYENDDLKIPDDLDMKSSRLELKEKQKNEKRLQLEKEQREYFEKRANEVLEKSKRSASPENLSNVVVIKDIDISMGQMIWLTIKAIPAVFIGTLVVWVALHVLLGILGLGYLWSL